MPELPEVETIVRSLRPELVGRRVAGGCVLWPRSAVPDAATLPRWLRGRRFVELGRRGKFLVARLEGGPRRKPAAMWLLIHLRMSGRLEVAEPGPRGPHVRIELRLDDGRLLRFEDARKFGRWVATPDPRPWLEPLGPEPLEKGFSWRVLAELLRSRRRQLKPLLLDQRVIAGLGNIYADEALFEAGLHPLRPSNTLSDAQVRRLHRAIRAVLRRAIRQQGTSIDWIYPGGRMQDSLRVYGRGGKACVRCGARIEVLRVGQRSTHVCPQCQDCPYGGAALAAVLEWQAVLKHREQGE